MNYTIDLIAALTGAHRYGTRPARIQFLLTDSRSLGFPEETLFFALTSQTGDGHRYIGELYRRGVRNFCVSRLPGDLSAYPDANFLKVKEPLGALQRLAERHRDEFSIPVVGITGSNGKTMVKEWLYHVLAPQMRVARSPRSYNSQIGVPLSVWLTAEDTEAAVFEAGISQPGEMRALATIIQPTIAVLTNIGEAHSENFPSAAGKCAEKLLLAHRAKTLVYPADDPVVAEAVARADTQAARMGWSRTDPAAPMYVSRQESDHRQTHIEYTYTPAPTPHSSLKNTPTRFPSQTAPP